MRRILTDFFLGSIVLVLTSGSAWAQATAQISGTVHDQSGAVLPGAEINATQTDTGITRMTISNETGSYVMPNLALGPYRLEASLPGFRTFVQTGIVLQVNSNPVINVVLEVGQVSEQVEVQANAALVETRSQGVGQVIENARILELPLNGRNVTDLITLAGAAVNQGNYPRAFANLPVINIAGQPTNGASSFGTDYSLDGADHRNYLTATTMPIAFPEAVQEFKVESSGQSAQRGSPASVSVVTKSGSNDFHGNLFEFMRNDGFGSAREYFSATKSALKRNQFGGTVGGPIEKNKMFFFGGFQATTLIQNPGTSRATIPTAQMLAGDWTTFASAGCNSGVPRVLRTPFANSRISPDQYSRTASYIVSKILPTIGVTPDDCGNIIYGTPSHENDYQYVGKLDYQFSSKQSLFFRALDTQQKIPSPIEFTKNLLQVGSVGSDQLAQSYAFGYTYLPSPNVVQAFRAAFHRAVTHSKNNYSFDFCEAGMRNFWCDSPHELGVANITGGFAVGGTSHLNNFFIVQSYAFDDDVSWVRSGHQMTFGGGITHGMTYQPNTFASVGQFTFNGQLVGVGLADFMVGLPATLLQGLPNTQHTRQNTLHAYFTDSWKVNRRLTFNYGVRWEPYLPMTVHNGQISAFDFDRFRQSVRSTVFVNAPLGFYFPGDQGFPGTQAVYRQWGHFAPRIGFAFDPSGDGKTSIRASYAYGYANIAGISRQDQAGSNPWGGRATYSTPGTFDNPYANIAGGNPYPFAIDKNVKFPIQGQFMTNDYDLPTPQTYSWNLGVQRQIGSDWIASVTYIGSRVQHLYVTLPINYAKIVPGPIVTTGCAATATNCNAVANIQARRVLSLINPTEGQLIGNMSRWDPSGTSIYNGLLMSLQKQFSHGISMSSNWTWAHCQSVFQGYDSKSDITSTVGDQPLFDRGNCDSDRRHIVNLTAVVQTPRFSNTFVRRVLTDWQLAGIYSFRSGTPISVQDGTDRQLSGINHQRPNLVQPNSVYTGKSGPGDLYFNPAAFEPQPLGTIGNLGWNGLIGPTYWTANLALTRQFRITERQKVEFRADAFNVTNSFVSAPPTTAAPGMATVPAFANLASNQFGQNLTAQPTRKIQFALKYMF